MPHYIQVNEENVVISNITIPDGMEWDISGIPGMFQTRNYEINAAGKRLIGWSEDDPMQPLFEDIQWRDAPPEDAP